MSDDMDREDRTLGAALSRAIETQPTRETPYARSRLARRIAVPRRGSIWTWMPVAAAAALVAAVALAAVLAGGRGDREPVAAPVSSPTATAEPTGAPPQATPRRPGDSVTLRVFFARQQLPPVAGTVQVAVSDMTAAGYTQARLAALPQATAPAGATNAAAALRAKVSTVRIEGDLAIVDFDVPADGWGIHGSASVVPFVDQLVYTATEQGGVRRVIVTQNGRLAVIDQKMVWDRPLTREDVFGYTFRGEPEVVSVGTPDRVSDLSSRISVDDFVPGLARLVITVAPRTAAPTGWTPAFSVQQQQRTPPAFGNATLVISVPAGVDPGPKHTDIGRAPVRSLTIDSPGRLAAQSATTYTVDLDDARPWRVAVLRDPLRIVIDIGGIPTSVSKAIAAYEPRPGAEVDRTFTVRGMARTFEANVQWRLRDASPVGAVLASGFTTASVGTSALWGTFEATVTAPAGARGRVVLEVFETSARDGTEIHKVSVPLVIR